MTKLRSDLPPLPKRMRSLPVDHRGYPVPWFVGQVEGRWDFRLVRPGGIALAHNRRTCWLCGQPMGQYKAFVIGPMCSINRISAEPPSHLDCAEFAILACPFLTRPLAKRNERDLPDETRDPPGTMLAHNPGVTCLWVTRDYTIIRDQNGGPLFSIGEPSNVEWWTEGRRASRAEVDAAIEKGLPFLRQPAAQEGKGAVAALDHAIERALKLRPAA